MILYITKAEYLGDLRVRLFFNDGTERDLDFTTFFKTHSHPQYNKYSEPKAFKKFTIDHGNIVWGKNWDMIFPIEDLHIGILS